ncbi:MAG TPA: PAS domain S-box protein [Spirochaetota bacterium]|nr:PAS domain S-box protein [Spirochaetota bacterium]
MDNTGGTILLVEDEVLIAMAEERQLAAAGYNVITAFSGEDAIEIAVNSEQQIDIILMDIDLGRGMDGTQAAMEILKYREIPVLFQSSHTEKDIVEKTEKITSYGYVVKHSGITILDASIKMAFKLHKAYKELKEKEENLLIKERAIESSINAIAISDPDGKIIYVNPSFLKLWGYDDINEVIGMKASMLMKKSGKNETACDNLYTAGGMRGEMIALRKDNTVFDVETSASEIFSQQNKHLGLIAAFQDITERKLAEAWINESRESYRVLVENIESMVCEVDCNGCYTYLSPSYKKITGYSPEELMDKPVTEHIHPDDFKQWSTICCSNKKPDNSIRGTWRFKIKNGEWRWLDCSITFFEKTPGGLRAVVISTDITDRINEEEKMRDIIRQNELYLVELRERVANNAAIIHTFVDFLMGRFENDASKLIFIQAESRIRFCVSIYEKFHALPCPSGINLYTCIHDILDSINIINNEMKESISVSDKMSEIMLNIKWVLPLGLVLNELISNSLKYSYSGDMQGEIEISHLCHPGKITLCITGKGKAFTGVEKNNKTINLGLSLALKVAEMINGEIQFSDESGTGCSFTFSP